MIMLMYTEKKTFQISHYLRKTKSPTPHAPEDLQPLAEHATEVNAPENLQSVADHAPEDHPIEDLQSVVDHAPRDLQSVSS